MAEINICPHGLNSDIFRRRGCILCKISSPKYFQVAFRWESLNNSALLHDVPLRGVSHLKFIAISQKGDWFRATKSKFRNKIDETV